MNKTSYPLVSIIIPFLNNYRDVLDIKAALDRQTYPREHYEVLLIDNGSTGSFRFSEDFSRDVTLLREDRYTGSPYSARNRGVEAAKGEVLVFLDANSTVKPRWLEQGVFCLSRSEADLVAGKVGFEFGEQPTAANIADALTSLNMKKAVEERGVAYTANLFVKKDVFEKTGLFEEGTRSGGDVRWTRKATEQGWKLAYCDDAVVYKKARNALALYGKRIRTGRGYFYTWQTEKEKSLWFYNLLRSFKPRTVGAYRKQREDLNDNLFAGKKTAVWFHLYAARILEQLAFVSEFFRYNLGSQRDLDRRKEMSRHEQKKE